LQQRIDVKTFYLERLAPGEGEQTMGQASTMLSRLLRGAHVAEDAVVILRQSTNQAEIAIYDLQEIVEIVSNPAGQVADRFYLLCLMQGRFGFQSFCDLSAQAVVCFAQFLSLPA
jgi:hypothetical protein